MQLLLFDSPKLQPLKIKRNWRWGCSTKPSESSAARYDDQLEGSLILEEVEFCVQHRSSFQNKNTKEECWRTENNQENVRNSKNKSKLWWKLVLKQR